MSQACSHPHGAMVVPEKIVPYFQADLLPKPESSVTEMPKSFGGRIKYFVDKSSLLTGTSLFFGSMTALAYSIETIPDPTMLTAAGVTLTSAFAGGLGLTRMALGFQSIGAGDMKYAPLPPTKKFLELEETKKASAIAPFENWDNMFNKNDARIQNMIANRK